MYLGMMRLPLVAIFRTSQKICSSGKPTLAQKCSWYRCLAIHGGMPVVLREPSLWQEGIRKLTTGRMEQISTTDSLGTDGINAEADGASLSLFEQEVRHPAAACVDEPEVSTSASTANASDEVDRVDYLLSTFDLPLHLQERLLNDQYLKAHVPAMEELRDIERNVEALYVETRCLAEKLLFEEPSRARVRSLFNRQSLERFLMKLLDCGVLRAMSALCLLQSDRCHGRCTREVVDIVCSLGFTARGADVRERFPELPCQAREIPGSLLSYYPKSLNNPKVMPLSIPCRSWPGLPRRLHAGSGSYVAFSQEHPLVVQNGRSIELRHGWYTLSPSPKNVHIQRMQVFKGLEDGVFHIFVQRQEMPCCWIHVSSYIEETQWLQLHGEAPCDI